ncbi:choice-of-anchor B family protein [Polaribacter glomeratus]|uniref:Regulator n=1 Tax=Polaribacter glomeratus TaxID=102 RepID=A0A2S7WGI1_9FLAO|nr:choice-of-anchor B family protein [Polaribacter glomeratus]PQJ76719.1 regulator [Polaribacter glomeratus]TXD67439.1 choice-of-anchor B family protein [Polaribacter glomeratus]
MKKITLIVILVSQYFLAQTPCVNGFAGQYPCKDYDLQSHISIFTIGSFGAEGNDSWGWVDPETQKEYALMGTTKGMTFIDISNPVAPIILGTLKTSTVNSPWRDVKVYDSHAFIVSEASNHGMQVFDLKRLRTVSNPPVNFTADTHFTGFGSAHNIIINESTGYAYIVGASRSSTYGGGPIFINIQNPTNPVIEGGFGAGGYAHDAQVITYNGPDTDYTGKEILIGSNENEVVIADVTNKANPIIISTISYTNVRYAHQGWFTEDLKYFILGDELDEQQIGNNTKTIVFDFTDLDNPLYHFDYFGSTAAIDHNGYIKDNIYFQANYTAGVRMIDVSNVENKIFTEVGFFDTYPNNNSTAFNGAWNVYPYFPSGNIIVSDINNGFFVIKKNGTLSLQNQELQKSFSVYPNPTSGKTTIKSSNNQFVQSIQIYNLLGQKMIEENNINNDTYVLDTKGLQKGVYFIKINNQNTTKLIVK